MRSEKQLIIALMEREGISQAELARRLGQSRSCINAKLKENNERSMLVSELVRYANALGYELKVTATKKG